MKSAVLKIAIAALISATVLIFSFELGKKKSENDHLSLDEVRDDFLQLTAKIEADVPNAFYYADRSKYESIKETVSSQLKDGMTNQELFQVFYPLVQCLNDAHFSIHLPDELMPNNDSYFPIRVLINEDRLYVLEDLSTAGQLKKGTEIRSINKVSASDILAKIRGTDQLDKNKQLFFEYRTEAVFHNRLYALFGFTGDFEIAVADSVYTVGGIEANKLKVARQKAYEFGILNAQTAYLKINQLTLPQDSLKHLLEKDFVLIKKQSINKLIIDIRGNLGGNSVLAKNILDYFLDTPYALAVGVDYFHQGKKYYSDTRNQTHTPLSSSNKFKGQVILLSDILTYSSAHMMQVGFKHLNVGVTIGNGSSEALYISGEIKQTVLKNSKIELVAPTVNFKLPGFSEGQKQYYTPDDVIYPTLSERLNGVDVMLAKALAIP